MLFIKNAPGGSSLSNLSAWWRLVNATNYLLHPTEFTCLITVVSPGQFVCFFLDGTLTIAGIRVVGEKLQPARPTLRRKFLEKSRHRHRIVPGLRHQMRSRQVRLALRCARELKQHAIGPQSNSQLSQAPQHRAPGNSGAKHQGQL